MSRYKVQITWILQKSSSYKYQHNVQVVAYGWIHNAASSFHLRLFVGYFSMQIFKISKMNFLKLLVAYISMQIFWRIEPRASAYAERLWRGPLTGNWVRFDIICICVWILISFYFQIFLGFESVFVSVEGSFDKKIKERQDLYHSVVINPTIWKVSAIEEALASQEDLTSWI